MRPQQVVVPHSAIKYRPDIDGLRALAVTSVVVYHVGLGGMRGGFIGVDIFFVISGYLIGSLVYNEIAAHTFSVARFYARRAKRILPALYVVLVFSYLAAFLLLSPYEIKNFVAEALATITSTSNILYALFTPGYFHPNTDLKTLMMTWSLGVEEQFYVVFPPLMLLLRKTRLRIQFWAIGSLALLSLVASVWGTAHFPIFTFYLLPTRSWELAVGVLLALLYANRPQAISSWPMPALHAISVVGLGLIVVAMVTLDKHTAFPGWVALMPVSGAAMIIVAKQGIVNRVLSWQPVVFVGLVSYPWYLWHWPILTFARITCATGIHTRTLILLGLVSFGCAVLSYKWIELPLRKSTTPALPLLMRYAVLAVAMMLPAAGLYFTHGLQQRNRSLQQIDMANGNLLMDKCTVELSEAHPPLRAPCVPLGHGRSIALVGDSHATALAGALHAIAERSGYRLVELTKGACPAIEESTPSLVNGIGLSKACLQFNAEALAYIVHDHSIDVVVIAAYWSLPFDHDDSGQRWPAFTATRGDPPAPQEEVWEQFQQGLDHVVSSLEQAGKSVYLVQDNPNFAFDPARLMRARLIAPRGFLSALLDSPTGRHSGDTAPAANLPNGERARLMIDRVAASHPDVRVIDLRATLCRAKECTFANGDNTLYIDDNHLSLLGAQRALVDLRLPF